MTGNFERLARTVLSPHGGRTVKAPDGTVVDRQNVSTRKSEQRRKKMMGG